MKKKTRKLRNSKRRCLKNNKRRTKTKIIEGGTVRRESIIKNDKEKNNIRYKEIIIILKILANFYNELNIIDKIKNIIEIIKDITTLCLLQLNKNKIDNDNEIDKKYFVTLKITNTIYNKTTDNVNNGVENYNNFLEKYNELIEKYNNDKNNLFKTFNDEKQKILSQINDEKQKIINNIKEKLKIILDTTDLKIPESELDELNIIIDTLTLFNKEIEKNESELEFIYDKDDLLSVLKKIKEIEKNESELDLLKKQENENYTKETTTSANSVIDKLNMML